MKKFKFRLEKVLEFRLSLKDERKRELLLANRALQEAETHLAWLGEELLRNGVTDGEILTVDELMLRGTYREKTKRALEEQREVVAMRAFDAGQALERYIEAAKEANTLETLKKKRFQEYFERIQKEEERALDESATQRFGRNLVQTAQRQRIEAQRMDAVSTDDATDSKGR